MWRKTTMRRAMAEGVALFVVGVALAYPRPDTLPVALFIPLLLARLALFILPPVWAAMRVVSTKREKMSRRFWRLGPTLALWCALATAALALIFGGTDFPFGGTDGVSVAAQIARHGFGFALGFLWGQALNFLLLAIYYTIAVVLTRLANGGFLRFTMPAGKGRVTL